MPVYLQFISIDWHADAVAAELRPLLPRADARLTATDHTWETFQSQLGELAAAHPGLVADALVEDGFRTRWLFRAHGGCVDEVCVVERFADEAATPVDLPYDDVVTVTLARALGDEPAGSVLEVPLYYPDEPALRVAIDRIAGAIDTGGGAFVADAGVERFLVELAAGRARVRALVAALEPALVAKLLRRDYAAVPAAQRASSAKYGRALYWPQTMLQLIQHEAARTDRSVSWIVQQAFSLARDAIAQRERDQLASALDPYRGDKRRQTLYFPGDMLDAMEHHAQRLDTSISFVAQCAVALARKALVAMPEATELAAI